jgi:hypothetical protein
MHYPSISLETEKSHEIPVRIYSLRADIRIPELPIRKREYLITP